MSTDLPSKTPPTAKPQLSSLDEALTSVLAAVRPLAATESVSTFDALGRVLAADVPSSLDVPPQDNTSMDGYALRTADVKSPGIVLPVSQRIPAGVVGKPLAAGSAARIFTGAQIPAGADAVVPQEQCAPVGDDQVRVDAVPEPGQWIRRRGEDVIAGHTVLARGERLTPQALGLAASVGAAELTVARRPRVALFSTGDELVMPGEPLPPGAIYNSNRFTLRGLLLALGCIVTDLGIVPDRLDATRETLRRAASGHDLILTCGGVSVGEEDHLRPAMKAEGRLDFWQIAMKPGKPLASGAVGDALFLGLPGNPVSSFVTFALIVRPVLLKLMGARMLQPKAFALRADFDWPKPDRRREFLRARLVGDRGLELYPNQSSGVLTSTVWADGLIDNPPGHAIARGDMVRFLPLVELVA